MRIRLLSIPLLLTVTACAQEARVGDPADGSVPSDAETAAPGTLGEFLQSFADAYCARIEDCCGGLPAAFPSREWCVTSIADELGEAAHTELPAEDAALAATCLEAVQAMGCADPNDARRIFDLFLTPEAETACWAAPLPRQGCGGTTCDGECIDDVCVGPVSPGESCCTESSSGRVCSNSLCDDLSYCDIDGDNLCRRRSPAGDPCTDSSQCASFQCDEASGRCEAATLTSWTCG